MPEKISFEAFLSFVLTRVKSVNFGELRELKDAIYEDSRTPSLVINFTSSAVDCALQYYSHLFKTKDRRIERSYCFEKKKAQAFLGYLFKDLPESVKEVIREQLPKTKAQEKREQPLTLEQIYNLAKKAGMPEVPGLAWKKHGVTLFETSIDQKIAETLISGVAETWWLSQNSVQ